LGKEKEVGRIKKKIVLGNKRRIRSFYGKEKEEEDNKEEVKGIK